MKSESTWRLRPLAFVDLSNFRFVRCVEVCVPPLPSPTCPPFRIGRSRLGTLLFNRSNKNEFNTTRTNHVIPVKSFDMVLTLLIQSFVFLMHSRNTLFVRKSCERLERMVQTVVKPYKDRKCKCKTQERYTSFYNFAFLLIIFTSGIEIWAELNRHAAIKMVSAKSAVK